MLVCSRFSALEGIWNEQEKSDKAFVQAHTVMCRATLLAIEEILKRRPDAVFIQSEVTEVYLERWPGTSEAVEFRNHRRFMTFDVLYGKEPDGDILMYLLDNGVSEDEHKWFMRQGRVHAARCVLGTDYYAKNERTVEPGGEEKSEGAMLGWGMIAVDYFERYRRPMMLTETNMIDRGGGEAKDWVLRTWHQAQALRKRGLPVIGYTWFSLTDQIDWNIELREVKGEVNANGLVDLDRKERDTGKIYRQLAHTYGREPLVQTLPPSLCGSTF
jgi:beta-glucosidase/6-phospho-beta-glucosidase/beta-galactosidase